MAITPAPELRTSVVDVTVDAFGAGGVPTSRQIIASGALTINGGPSHDLSSDITIAPVASPAASPILVGTGRTLTSSTTALTVNGGGSADFSANLTLAIASFAGTTPGLVPVGTNNGGLFLSQTGWTAGTIVGVASLTLDSADAIELSANTGAIVIGTRPAAFANAGHVPAVGAADPTQFLCRTIPPSWATPGSGSFVTLQGSFPGSVDVGGIFVSSAICGGAISGGAGASDGMVSSYSTGSLSVFIGKWVAGDPDPDIFFRAGRGTRTAPTSLADLDSLAVIKVQGRGTANYSNPRKLLFAQVDGAPSASDFKMRAQLHAGLTLFPAKLHASDQGFRFSLGEPVADDTPKSKSGVEIATTYGRTVKVIDAAALTAGAYTLVDTDPSVILVDGTAAAIPITLPSAVTRSGRTYTFVRVDASGQTCTLIPVGGQLIGGHSIVYLAKINESVTIRSDGSNWWISGGHRWAAQYSNLANGAALANSVVNTEIMAKAITGFDQAGAVFGLRAFGQLSTTGTPTLRWTVDMTSGSVGVIADTGAITMPNGVTGIPWEMECEWLVRSVAALQATFVPLKARVGLVTGGGAMTFYNAAIFAPPAKTCSANAPRIYAQWGTANPSNTMFVSSMLTYSYPSSNIA